MTDPSTTPSTTYSEPATPAPSDRQIRLRRVAQLLGAVAMGLGGTVLLGHVLGLEGAATLGKNSPPMVGHTAIMVFLAGCSLWLIAPRERGGWRTLAARLLGGTVSTIAAVTLAEYVVGVEGADFDLWLLPDQWLPETVRWPGRPSPHTAASSLLLGLALVLLDRGGVRGLRPAEAVALLGVAVPLVSLLGYAFRVEALYGVPRLLPYTGMAIHTAVALLLIGFGVLLARPETGLTAVGTSEGPGGVATRRMLVGMAILPLLAVIAFVRVERGLLSVPVAASLVVMGWVVVLVGFVLTTAVRLERTAEAARAGEEVRARQAALVASSMDAIIATTPDTVIMDWNPAAERIYGYPAGEMLGRSLFTLVPPQEADVTRSIVERVLRRERVPDYETVRVRQDGTLVPVSVAVAPIVAVGGEVVGISSISRDISARRAADAARDAAERELLEAHRRERASREELDRVLRAGGAVADALPALPAANMQHVLTVLGLQAQELTGAGMVAVGVHGDAERPFEHWVYSGVDESVARAIGRRPRARGVLGVSAIHGEVVRVPDVHQHPAFVGLPEHHPELTSLLAVPVSFLGRPVGNIYLGNKRGAAEFSESDERVVRMFAARAGASIETAQLYESENLQRVWLQSVFDHMPEGVVIVGPDGRVSNANHVARAHMAPGDDSGPVFRSPSGVPLLPEEQPARSVLTSGKTLVGLDLTVFEPTTGELLPVTVSATPVRIPEGVAGAVIVYRDARASKELERLREEWSCVVAHDLRQPLSVIRTGAEILVRYGKDRLSQAEARTLRSMTDAARQLDRMIADLMDASRIEAHRLTLDRRVANLTALVTNGVELTRQQEPERQLVLDAEAGLRVWVDADRIRQVLANLLSNAVKYGDPAAPIEVRLHRRDEATMQLTVSNRGPGIPPDELETLFSRFSRTREARAGSIPGSGLGLYISRGLVEAQGGSLWAESTPGATTDFHLVLPLAPEAVLPHAD